MATDGRAREEEGGTAVTADNAALLTAIALATDRAALITEAEARLGMQARQYAVSDLMSGEVRFNLWFPADMPFEMPAKGKPYVVLSAETLAGLLALAKGEVT